MSEKYKMKLFVGVKLTGIVLIGIVFLTGCATIIGGSNYYAYATVNNHPNATITYKGITLKNERSFFKVRRADANKLSFTVKEKDCEDQTIEFNRRSFRGWAFAGTLVGWTGLYQGIPLPWGVVVDFATGALWKPDITEKGVTKMDIKHYDYLLDYTGCKSKLDLSKN